MAGQACEGSWPPRRPTVAGLALDPLVEVVPVRNVDRHRRIVASVVVDQRPGAARAAGLRRAEAPASPAYGNANVTSMLLPVGASISGA